MSIITELLSKEAYLNVLLNSSDKPLDLEQQFEELYTNSYYENTKKFLNLTSTYYGLISNFVEKQESDQFNISFNIDSMLMFIQKGKYDFEEIGTVLNSQFIITGLNSIGNINNQRFKSFLIDEQNKEIAFGFLQNNLDSEENTEIISYTYKSIEFIKGQEQLYENNNYYKFKI